MRTKKRLRRALKKIEKEHPVLYPILGRVVVEREHEEQFSKGGLYLHNEAKYEKDTAKVFHPGYFDEFGVGDTVVVTRDTGHDFDFDGLSLTILDGDLDVLGVVVDTKGKKKK